MSPGERGALAEALADWRLRLLARELTRLARTHGWVARHLEVAYHVHDVCDARHHRTVLA